MSGTVLKKFSMLAAMGLGLIAAFVVLLLVRTSLYGSAGKVGSTAPRAELAPPEKAAAIRHLQEAIRFRTIATDEQSPRAGENAPWRDFQAWMSATYPAFHAQARKRQFQEHTVLYHWPGSDPATEPIMLMAHQDVVPVNPGTESDWDAPPFSGDIVGEHVIGRGTLDDKSSVVMILEALDALARDGFTPARGIYVLLDHNEEASGAAVEEALSTLAAEGVRASLVLDEGFFTIEDTPLTGQPVSIIGVAEKGYISVEITATGSGGHSSQPGRDEATVRLARALLALEETQMPSRLDESPMPQFFQGIAEDMPFTTRLAFANKWLLRGMIERQMSADPGANALIRTTTAITMLEGSIKENVLPQRAKAVVNFRIHPSDTPDDVIAHVREVTRGIAGLTIEPHGGIASNASAVSPAQGPYWDAMVAMAKVVDPDAPVVPGLVIGVTDARFGHILSDSVYRYLPISATREELAGMHGTNERLALDNVTRMIEAYQTLILTMDTLP